MPRQSNDNKTKLTKKQKTMSEETTEVQQTEAEININDLINSDAGMKAMSQALSNENQQNDFNQAWRKENSSPNLGTGLEHESERQTNFAFYGDPYFEFAKDMLLENRVWKKRKNVRANNLNVGQTYLMKKRNINDQCNYDQDTMAVRFLGVRNNDTGDFVGVNIPVSKLDRKSNDANVCYEYVFEMFYSNLNGECKETEPSECGAYNWNGSLAIGSGAINVSFFEVNKKGFFELLLNNPFHFFSNQNPSKLILNQQTPQQ